MNIDDGCVLAVSGAMLADGEFQFEGEDAHEFLRPVSAMVAVRSRSGRLGTDFGLVGNARCDADGLWSADWPVHSLAFQTTFPPLDQLLDFPSFVLRQTPSQALLGPAFHGDFLVPTAFLFVRGILLRNQWAERQRRLGKN